MSEEYNVPLIDNAGLVDFTFGQCLRFCEHIAIETKYLKRPPTLEEMRVIYLEYMLDPSLKEKYGSGSRTTE
jgi:hypothetical protein